LAEVTAALRQLVEWGNLRADPDTSRVTTVEDFHRARFLYQLTHQGEAAEGALEAYDGALGRRGSLQAVALSDIVTQLRALAGQDEPDAGRVHLLLGSLVGRFTDLAGNTRAFMGSLQRTIDVHDANTDAFLAYKDRLIDYLQRFIKDLIVTGGEIAQLVDELETSGVDRLLRMVAASEAGSSRRRSIRRRRDCYGRRRGRPSRSCCTWWAALHERRAGRSDRSADFRALACWFAQSPGDDELHRLWWQAFGLTPSRHLAGRDVPAAPVGAFWSDAPPVQISPRLRKTGSYERRGRPQPAGGRCPPGRTGRRRRRADRRCTRSCRDTGRRTGRPGAGRSGHWLWSSRANRSTATGMRAFVPSAWCAAGWNPRRGGAAAGGRRYSVGEPAGGRRTGRCRCPRLLGNVHALDDDRPVATLVLGAARCLPTFRTVPVPVPNGVARSGRRSGCSATSCPAPS
jgi:hypothetical protein